MPRKLVSTLLGLVGAAIGGAIGVFGFHWLYQRGFYAMVLPGAMVGVGCGLLARDESLPRGLICGAAGLVLGLWTEWHFRPFADGGGFGHFLTHLGDLDTPQVTLGLIAVGAVMAFWMGKGHFVGAWGERSQPPQAPPA